MNWLIIGGTYFEDELRKLLTIQGDTVRLLIPDQRGKGITSPDEFLDWLIDHSVTESELNGIQFIVDFDGLDLGFMLAAELALEKVNPGNVYYLTAEDDRSQILDMISGGDVISKKKTGVNDFVEKFGRS